MSNIIDKIRVSGTDYTLSATSSGGNPTIEVTQAEYDALVSAGTVQEDTYYIITDSSIDYINSAQCQSQIDSSISGKADTSAVTEAIDAAVSGKVSTSDFNAYSGSVNTTLNSKASQSDLNSLSGTVTGHTANTAIHVTSSEKTMWSGKADTSAVTEAIDAAVSGKVDTSTYTAYTAATDSRIYGVESEVSSKVDKIYLDNRYEDGVKIEYYGDNGGHYIDDLTLFDVGSGLTIEFSGNTWVLSATGGSGTVSSAITSGDTNAVAGGAVYDKFDEVEQVTAAALNDINDRVSEDEEVTAAALNYLNEHGGGGGGNPTVELTQAEYDALVSAGTVSADTYYIITDATPVDMSNYYTSAQTNTLLEGKQDTLSTGRGISIANDTISFSLPISAGTGLNSVKEGYSGNNAAGNFSHVEGYSTNADVNGYVGHAEGYRTYAMARFAHAEGWSTSATSDASHAEGAYTITKNEAEHASGRYNVSSSASTTFGDSGNTLFSVGNGTADNARHNAFEIRQNGDIYLSSGGTGIKLQDHLGGGGSSYTAGDGIDITSNVISVTGKVDTSTYNTYTAATGNRLSKDEEVTAAALNNLNEALSGKQDTLSAGTNITIVDNVISAEGGGGKAVSAGTNISITTGETADTINCTLPISVGTGNFLLLFNNDTNNIKSSSKTGFIWGSQNGLYNPINSNSPFIIGDWNEATANAPFIHGHSCKAKGLRNFISGYKLNANYPEETAFGHWNNSVTGSTDADKTLFSVGNGTSESARHNAFEIKHNGDIYITINDQDVKLQDQLGGGGSSYSAGTGIDITNDVISVTGMVETSAITTAITSSSTDAQVPSAKAVNDKLGGLSLVKLTQAQYDALATKDNNTLYVIVN